MLGSATHIKPALMLVPFPLETKDDTVKFKSETATTDTSAIQYPANRIFHMTEAMDSTSIQSENGHAHVQKNPEELPTAPGHQKHSSTSTVDAPAASDSGVTLSADTQQTSIDNGQPLTSPMYIQKSRDAEDEDYDPYPYGSTLSPSFIPPTAEAIAQAQAEQIAMIQHHQAVQQPKLQGKGKDLSHVPCRFFKIGGCTAGLACPFSHSLGERESIYDR